MVANTFRALCPRGIGTSIVRRGVTRRPLVVVQDMFDAGQGLAQCPSQLGASRPSGPFPAPSSDCACSARVSAPARVLPWGQPRAETRLATDSRRVKPAPDPVSKRWPCRCPRLSAHAGLGTGREHHGTRSSHPCRWTRPGALSPCAAERSVRGKGRARCQTGHGRRSVAELPA
jgi:hypothetical protein